MSNTSINHLTYQRGEEEAWKSKEDRKDEKALNFG